MMFDVKIVLLHLLQSRLKMFFFINQADTYIDRHTEKLVTN